MGGTQRPAKFAKYLPNYGWQVTVLTVKPIAYWAQDASVLKELEQSRIIRTGSLDPQRVLQICKRHKESSPGASHTGKGLLSFINETVVPLLILPDSKILWRWHAVLAASRLLRSEKFDAIFTTSPPHSVHLIGRLLAKKFSLPWVADFRDAWSGGVVVREPTPIHALLQKRLQDKVLTSANEVICVSEGIRQDLSQQYGQEDKFHLITNGFDPEDYPVRTRKKDDGLFLFCHSGSITRFSDPAPVLQALRSLKAQQPELARRIQFIYVGYDAIGDFMSRVTEFGLEDMIRHPGYLSHREALQHLVNADALVLVACGGKEAHFIPGKTFEYLGAQKPILAVSNVADTIELLKPFPWVHFCSPDDADRLSDVIKQISQTKEKIKADSETLKIYDRAYQARQLALVLDRIVST